VSEVGRTASSLLWRHQTHQNCNNTCYYCQQWTSSHWIERVKTYLYNALDPARKLTDQTAWSLLPLSAFQVSLPLHVWPIYYLLIKSQIRQCKIAVFSIIYKIWHLHYLSAKNKMMILLQNKGEKFSFRCKECTNLEFTTKWHKCTRNSFAAGTR